MDEWTAFVSAATGVVFVAAGILKLVSGSSLAGYLLAIGLPRRARSVVEHTLPGVELGVGLMLMLDVLSRISTAIACVLALSFVLGQILAESRSVDEQCGCFGALDTGASSMVSMTRAALILAAAVFLLASNVAGQTPDVFWPAELSVRILGVAVGVAFVLAFGLMNQSARLRRTDPIVRGSVA